MAANEIQDLKIIREFVIDIICKENTSTIEALRTIIREMDASDTREYFASAYNNDMIVYLETFFNIFVIEGSNVHLIDRLENQSDIDEDWVQGTIIFINSAFGLAYVGTPYFIICFFNYASLKTKLNGKTCLMHYKLYGGMPSNFKINVATEEDIFVPFKATSLEVAQLELKIGSVYGVTSDHAYIHAKLFDEQITIYFSSDAVVCEKKEELPDLRTVLDEGEAVKFNAVFNEYLQNDWLGVKVWIEYYTYQDEENFTYEEVESAPFAEETNSQSEISLLSRMFNSPYKAFTNLTGTLWPITLKIQIIVTEDLIALSILDIIFINGKKAKACEISGDIEVNFDCVYDPTSKSNIKVRVIQAWIGLKQELELTWTEAIEERYDDLEIEKINKINTFVDNNFSDIYDSTYENALNRDIT